MRDYRGSYSLLGLLARVVLALIGVMVLVAVFKTIFAIIATLLTFAVIAIIIVVVLRYLSNNPRRNRW